ncbi:MAG: ATP synthase subunit beta, partial [Microgenomates bacterium OLB23]
MKTGKVVAIRGVVVDIEFSEKNTPEIYEALIAPVENKEIVLEVQAIIGEGRVRAVAMDATYGLKRGADVQRTGAPINVPIGNETLGRMFNVLGQAIDEKRRSSMPKERDSIQKKAPLFCRPICKMKKIFETGIKVIDLLTPFIKGGKIAIYGGAGVGKTVIIQ